MLFRSLEEVTPTGVKGEQLRGHWNAKIGGAELVIGLYVLPRKEFGLDDPADVLEVIEHHRTEIAAKGGARLVEVGATNKTHAEDYEEAIASGTVKAILKVHRSNFSQTGFVAEVGLEALCGIARRRGIPVIYDQGTGVLEAAGAARDRKSTRLNSSH